MLQRIKYFLKAAECGSFSTAAQKLYISPQALTKQIGILEEELGGKLFERSPHGVKLTRFGLIAQQKLEISAREFDNVIGELRNIAESDKQTIRIGFFAALPQEELIRPVVSYLLSEYPQYQISLEMIELEEGRKKLEAGRLDLLFTNIHEQDNMTQNECLVFSEHDTRVVVSLTHPWVMKDQVTAQDLQQETFIKMEMDDEHYLVSAEDNFYMHIPCKSIKTVSNFDTLLILLQQGAGFGVFPMAFFNQRYSKVKSFDYPGNALKFYTCMVCRYKISGLPEIRKLIEGIREEFDLYHLN